MEALARLIDEAFENRAALSPSNAPSEIRDAVEQTLALLDQGELRVAEKRDGRWAIVERQPIYEKDRMDPVDPAARVELDQTLLMSFPEGYRHLAYLQSRIGYKIKMDMPGVSGPELERLYAMGKRWLKTGKMHADN